MRQLDDRRSDEVWQQFKGKYALKYCATSLFEALKGKNALDFDLKVLINGNQQ
ncbi:hypothetical protein [Paenibacillus cymbidii]|uniref:hypothetical protein n=1 Tax=Paenibacillus cymbidii TaxID=1639034 RepID=UPI001436CBD1|nr:hypothetical protein [Paenibacillus cymbidii]